MWTVQHWPGFWCVMDGCIEVCSSASKKHAQRIADEHNAWLREHPADDAEPVTMEWLRTVIGEIIRDDDALAVRLSDDAVIFWNPPDQITRIPGHCTLAWRRNHLPRLATRGDVRRLCAGLGVKLKWQGES